MPYESGPNLLESMAASIRTTFSPKHHAQWPRHRQINPPVGLARWGEATANLVFLTALILAMPGIAAGQKLPLYRIGKIEPVDEQRATKYRRELILFTKRSQFLRLTMDQLLEVSGLGAFGVSRQKLYDLLRYAWALGKGCCREDIVPPASRYLMGLQRAGPASNPRAQIRPSFRNGRSRADRAN